MDRIPITTRFHLPFHRKASTPAEHQDESPLVDTAASPSQTTTTGQLRSLRHPCNCLTGHDSFETFTLADSADYCNETVPETDGSTALSPLMPAKAFSEHQTQRSVSSFSSLTKTISRRPSSTPSRPEPLALNPDRRSYSREEGVSIKFGEIRDLCARGKHKHAAEDAIEFLRAYAVRAKIDLPFEDEMRRNVRLGGKRGLAGTGQGYAPIHFFAFIPLDCAFEMKLLVEHGVDVNATDTRDPDPRPMPYRALPIAVEQGNNEVASTLLHAPDIDIEVTDSAGWTPIFVALRALNMSLIEMLLQQGAQTTLSDGRNLFFLAVAWGMPSVVRLLIKRKEALPPPGNFMGQNLPILAAAILARNVDGTTTYTVDRKVSHRQEIVQLLLKAGADPMAKDDLGETALDYAILEDAIGVAQMLEEAMDATPDIATTQADLMFS